VIEDSIEFQIIVSTVKVAVVLGIVLTIVPLMVWFERRGSAWIQGRVGPNRVGPFGLLQPIADVIKFIYKEDPVPDHVSKFYFVLAPVLSLVPAILAFSVIPFGGYFIYDGVRIFFQIANLNSGVLFVFAISGLEIYGILLAGWASNNKYALLGTIRSSSQIISYEIALGLSIASILLVYGNVGFHEIVSYQSQPFILGLPRWGFFLNPIAGSIFWISIFAETNRLPFDLPEGESELVAGYHVEYGSIKFALFFMAEYIAMTAASCLLVTLFFGGYELLPGLMNVVEWLEVTLSLSSVFQHNLMTVFQALGFLFKIGIVLFVFVWVRWTIPRFRYDQVMNLGWRVLFPISMVNLMITAIVIYYLER